MVRYLILIIVLLLNACTNVSRQDGPPNFHVDASKIPNAVPKVEPLSKYGNKNYYVFGKRYKVLKNSQNFSEIGVASWYGTKFHKRRTSSGERYNMLAMTAAHRSLPLPTYALVRNLNNDRTIIVKINDRGPFASNRIIDLSYVAAKKLGMLGRGTTTVKITAIDPKTWWHTPRIFAKANNGVKKSLSIYTAYEAKVGKHVYVRVGTFKNKHTAEQLKRQLSNLINSKLNIKATPHEKRMVYQIQIGPIKDRDTANKVTSRLKKIGIQSNGLT